MGRETRSDHNGHITMIKKTHAEFLQDVRFYDITILGQYKGSLKPVKSRCDKCGHIWHPIANNLIQGSGCIKCFNRTVVARHKAARDQADMFRQDVELIVTEA